MLTRENTELDTRFYVRDRRFLKPERKQKMGIVNAMRSKETRPVRMTTRKGGAGRGKSGRGKQGTESLKADGVPKESEVRKQISPDTIMHIADPVRQVTVKQEMIDAAETKANSVSLKLKWANEKGRQSDLFGYFNKGGSGDEPVVVDEDSAMGDAEDTTSNVSGGNEDAVMVENEKERGDDKKEARNEQRKINFDGEGSWDGNESSGHEDLGTDDAPDPDGDRGEGNQKRGDEKCSRSKKEQKGEETAVLEERKQSRNTVKGIQRRQGDIDKKEQEKASGKASQTKEIREKEIREKEKKNKKDLERARRSEKRKVRENKDGGDREKAHTGYFTSDKKKRRDRNQGGGTG